MLFFCLLIHNMNHLNTEEIKKTSLERFGKEQQRNSFIGGSLVIIGNILGKSVGL